jgi:hypothetical protein
MFEFLIESKAFRNEKMIEKFSVTEMSEICFAMFLALELMDCDHSIVSYKNDTLKYPTYDRMYLSTTDLGNVMACLKNSKEILDNKYNVDLPILDMKRYLRPNIMSRSDNMAFFYKLHTKLKIHNGSLITLRREIVDSGKMPEFYKKKIGNDLIHLLRKFDYRCDILILLQRFLEKI